MPGIDSNAKLMLHFNGADGVGTVTDSSNTGYTVTSFGNFQLDTAHVKFGTAAGLFDGVGDYLTVSDAADWNFGTSDFVIDLQVSLDTLTLPQYFISNYSLDLGFWLRFDNSTGLHFSAQENGGSPSISLSQGSISGWSKDTFYHIAVVRSGNLFGIFKDGVAMATSTNSLTMPDAAADLTIGRDQSSTTDYLFGSLDELRISKETDRGWIDGFTPPTSEYTGYDGSVTIPLLTLSAFSDILSATITLPAVSISSLAVRQGSITFPILSIQAEKKIHCESSLKLPRFGNNLTGKQGKTEKISLKLPALTISIQVGLKALNRLPQLRLTTIGYANAISTYKSY